MLLHTETLGGGSRSIALIHGASGDLGTWFELAPRLAERDYTVHLIDLRGHGLSPRAASYRPEEFADDVVETLPAGLDVVIGHSLGGRTLSHAVDRLRPKKAIYFDPGWIVSGISSMDGITPFDSEGDLVSAEVLQGFLPRWSRAHIEQALRSAARFDTAVLFGTQGPLSDYTPPRHPGRPSLVVLADPSELVPPALQAELRADGYEVRTVPGTGHNFHIEDLEGTLAALEGWV